MGILITTDLEQHIYEILADSTIRPLHLTAAIVDSLFDAGYIRDDVEASEYPLLMDLITGVLVTPCHPQNTPEQDVWRKARCISHNLINERYREKGYARTVGAIRTTRDYVADAFAPDPGTPIH